MFQIQLLDQPQNDSHYSSRHHGKAWREIRMQEHVYVSNKCLSLTSLYASYNKVDVPTLSLQGDIFTKKS
jgi:hypothetical protein